MPPEPTEAQAPAGVPRAAHKPRLPALHGTGPLIGLVLLCIAGMLLNENFATVDNAMNVLTRTAFIGIIAVGMCFVIISGGVNIYPQEVEDAITMHPAVLDVAVIGVPHPEMGEEVKAVVQLAPGVSADDQTRESLMEHLRDRLAKYKLPRSLDFVDELPRTPTGKLRKHQLRERYAAGS